MALDSITLGRRLREARENRRLTQEQAARAIGVSRTALVHIESGKRSLSTLELSGLAKLYQRSVTDFFAEDETRGTREEDPLLIIPRLPTELINNPAIEQQVSRCVDSPIGADLEHARQASRHQPAELRSVPVAAWRRPIRRANRGGGTPPARLGYGPIADMSDLITTQGVWARQRLPDEMSGISPALIDGWSFS
ncbi:MAG: helix-turn-helix transcriptional regulator [Singulisphaera sp.]